jgi:tetratricopeptide (TPR) repeat protein
MTKLKNLISILDKNDIENLKELIPTRLMGGNQLHLSVFEAYASKKSNEDNLPLKVTDRLIMSDVCRMIERYLIFQESKKPVLDADIVLLRYYRIHENEKLFNDLFNKCEKLVHHPQFKNSKYYQFIGELLFEKWQFDQLTNRFSNTDINQIILMSTVADFSKKLEQLITLVPQSLIISKKIDRSYFDAIEPVIMEKNLLEFPCIALYYYAFKMLVESEKISWFEAFETHLSRFQSYFDADELKTLYFQAINYCIRKHNSGILEFSTKLLDYYKIGLEKGYFLINGYLSKNTYRNVGTIALRLKLIDEAIFISERFRSLLRKDEELNAYHFNMANIFYEQRLFDKALEALRYVNFDDHLSNLFAKTLMLKIYYESKEDRLLDSHLDAMQVYLTRKKLTGTYKSNYANVIKYTKKLNKLKPYDDSSRAKLRDDIQKEKYLPDKNWFFQQFLTCTQ